MEQAVKTEQGRASFTKKIGQTTFRVNVYFVSMMMDVVVDASTVGKLIVFSFGVQAPAKSKIANISPLTFMFICV